MSSLYSFLISQYPGKLASLAFFPNKRSHTSAICEASGDAKLVGTCIVVPFGIPARSCLSLHSNTAAIISSLLCVGRNFYWFYELAKTIVACCILPSLRGICRRLFHTKTHLH